MLLRRLTLAAQHPALPLPIHLFYLHCLLNFLPENWPLGPTDESRPLLLGSQLYRGLLPNLLNEPMALLARLHLPCLLCVEDEEKGKRGQVRIPALSGGALAGLRQKAALDDGPGPWLLSLLPGLILGCSLPGWAACGTDTFDPGLAQLYPNPGLHWLPIS